MLCCVLICFFFFCFFFFNDTASTEIYTLSLHDALPIYNGTGNYAVAFSNNMQSDGYAVSNSAASSGTVYDCWMGSVYGYPTTSNVGLGSGYDTPVEVDTIYVTSTIVGDLA